jgi:hypothetical protein
MAAPWKQVHVAGIWSKRSNRLNRELVDNTPDNASDKPGLTVVGRP